VSVPEGGESTLPRRPTRSASSAASPTPSSLAQPASGSLSVEGAALTKEILEELETQRAKVFFRVTTGLTLLVLAALPFLPGAAWLRAMTAAFCFVASLVSVFVVVRATKPRRRSSPSASTSSARARSARSPGRRISRARSSISS
jgi:hypothetical protein